MTREEIKDELFDIILKNSSPTMVVKRTIDYQQTMAIVAEFITHENNLLKEFVEFAKGEFIKANYCYNDTYLDTMLEMFLEEHEE